MDIRRVILGCLILVLFVSVTSALTVDYYFHPSCGHCLKIKPFINNFVDGNWNLFDTSQNSYDIQGTPTIKIKTNDNREITLTGSVDIPLWLSCELEEMSTNECQTYSADHCIKDSWFIR